MHQYLLQAIHMRLSKVEPASAEAQETISFKSRKHGRAYVDIGTCHIDFAPLQPTQVHHGRHNSQFLTTELSWEPELMLFYQIKSVGVVEILVSTSEVIFSVVKSCFTDQRMAVV
jgi:hypothetical protein